MTTKTDVERALKRAKEIGAPVTLDYVRSDLRDGLQWMLVVVGTTRVLGTAMAYEVITAVNATTLKFRPTNFDAHADDALAIVGST